MSSVRPSSCSTRRLQIEVERRARDRNQSQRSAVQFRKPGGPLVFEQPLIGRGNAVENGDTLFGHRPGERGRIIFRDKANRRAGHQGHGEQRNSDDVGDRQHAILHVGGRHAAKRSRRLGAEQQIAVGKHDALRRPGRARGVDENGDLPGAVRFHRLRGGILIERGHADAGERADILHRRAIAQRMCGGFLRRIGREESTARAAVVPDLIQLARRQPRVGNDRPGVETEHGDQETGQRDAILADDHHTVASADTQRAQRVCGAVHRAIKLPVCQRRAVVDQRHAIRRCRDVPIHHLVDAAR